MKKMIWVMFLGIFTVFNVSAQSTVYNPQADVNKDFAKAVSEAKSGNKFVLIQVGGNWCKWCIKFHKEATEDVQLDSAIRADYVYLLVNYSKENKNEEFLSKMGYPQRFGFPVFLVCDTEGKVIHIQDSWYLEDGTGGYDKKKVLAFFKNWTPRAVAGK
jgi:thioredoxin-related protein